MAEVHHTGITVSDLERSTRFYSEHFDLREVNRTEMAGEPVEAALGVPGATIVVIMLAADNTVVELIQYTSAAGEPIPPSNSAVGAAHVCFEVDDIEAAYDSMVAKGVTFNSAPSPALESGNAIGSRFAYLLDPDGITVELLQPGPNITLPALIGS